MSARLQVSLAIGLLLTLLGAAVFVLGLNLALPKSADEWLALGGPSFLARILILCLLLGTTLGVLTAAVSRRMIRSQIMLDVEETPAEDNY